MVNPLAHPYAALGAMTWLMAQSPYHRQWNAHDVHTELLPPIVLGQYRLYRDTTGTPIGFATWAHISDDVLAALQERRRPLVFDDWNSGATNLINDFVAPWGHGPWIVNELRATRFAGQQGIGLRRRMDGSIRKTYRWRGKAAPLPELPGGAVSHPQAPGFSAD